MAKKYLLQSDYETIRESLFVVKNIAETGSMLERRAALAILGGTDNLAPIIDRLQALMVPGDRKAEPWPR